MTSATGHWWALESYLRNSTLGARATKPTNLPPPPPPVDRASFAPGLVRKAVTPTGEFYGMSKNSIDPLIDPAGWRLKITENGRLVAAVQLSGTLIPCPATGASSRSGA